MKALVAGLLSGAASSLGSALVSMASKLILNKDFFKWAILQCAEQLVKSTKTPHDDKWFAQIKLMLEGPK